MAYHHALACISSPKVYIINRRLYYFRNDDIQDCVLMICNASHWWYTRLSAWFGSNPYWKTKNIFFIATLQKIEYRLILYFFIQVVDLVYHHRAKQGVYHQPLGCISSRKACMCYDLMICNTACWWYTKLCFDDMQFFQNWWPLFGVIVVSKDSSKLWFGIHLTARYFVSLTRIPFFVFKS